MSRSDDLRSEYLFHKAFLDTHRPADAASTLVNNQIQQRLQEIDVELLEAQVPHLDLRLIGDITARQAIPATTLTSIVGRMQSALTWAAWARRSGPGITGEPPTNVERASAAEFYALTPASFRFGLRPVAGPGESDSQENLAVGGDPWTEAAATVMDVTVAAASAEAPGDDVDRLLRNLGPAATRRLQALMASFAASGTDIELAWERPQRRQEVRLSAEKAAQFVRWLSAFQESLDEIEVRGVLRVLDTIRERFGIEESETGRLHEGKAAPELLQGAEVDAGYYTARIQVRYREAEHTGALTERLTLLSLIRISQDRSF